EEAGGGPGAELAERNEFYS
ncbi:hypothetical protein L195_g049780, partial [Trifolium pratense]